MIQLHRMYSNSLVLMMALVLEDVDDCDGSEIRIPMPRPSVMARRPRNNA
jgi:hypothetical protein